MTSSSKSPFSSDSRPWAAPRVGLPVERREPWELAMHGARDGLIAGLGLGVVEIGASSVLQADPWLPFDFAAEILTGLAMSPALAGRFPWFPRLFGGRQAARSLHFLGLWRS